MAREQFRCFHALRVRWAEVDRQGIVFNAHYLTYFDVAIAEYWRAIGYPYPDALLARGCDTFVRKATVEYHAPAGFDDVLEVGVRVARIGRSSMRFVLEIYRGQERLIEGEIVYVNADPATREPAPVPEFLREAITRYEISAPQSA
jgi:acyl-CoA thioester hydrolase